MAEEIKSFVEIEGKKFQEDPDNKGNLLKDDKGNSIPFEESKHIDYQALYEEEKTRRVKAESIIQRHTEKPKEEEDTFVETPDVRTIVKEELEDFKHTISSQLRTREIGEAIQKTSTDAHEAALIRWHYDNSIRPSGDLELDVENARALANKRRVQNQFEEMKASIISKETVGTGSGAGRRVETPKEGQLPTLTDADRQNLEWLKQRYVLSNEAVIRIINGETIESLLQSGVAKKR